MNTLYGFFYQRHKIESSNAGVVLDLHWLCDRFNPLDPLTLLSGFDPLSTEAQFKVFGMRW
jgi:hypothetical protein